MADIRRGFAGAVSPFLLQRLLLPPLENAYSTPETRAFVRQMRRQYAGLDKELKTGPTLLYLWLYFFCHDKDYCWPSQKLLSVLCKTTVRSVQNHLAALVRLEYIAVEQQGTRNIYRLLESERVRRQIVEAGMELMEDENFSPLKLKLAEEKGEKSSCSLLKELKKKEEITDHLFYI